MIVGEQIRIQGIVEGGEDVVVRGRVEGTVRVGGTLTIEPGAWVIAEVEAREVIVRGTLRGNARALEGVEVARTGRMVGDAVAPRVTIAAGAGFRGRVEMGDAPGPDEAPPPFPPVSAPAAAVAPASVAAAVVVAPAAARPAPRPVAPQPAPARPAPPAPAIAGRGIPPLSRPASTMKRRAEIILDDESFEAQRQRLLVLLRRLSYERREVILASGRSSNFYIDCKQAVLTAEGHFLAGWLIHRVLVEKAPEVMALGGLTMGADPLSSAASTVSFLGGRPLNAFYVRKEPKAHGTQKWIEGEKATPAGTRVAIVEDVITTGASTRKAIERARLHGLVVQHVVALVDREEGGREEIEKDAPLTTLFRRSEF